VFQISRKFIVSCSVLCAAVCLTPQRMLSDPFDQTNLVSDVSGLAIYTDPALKNPWGVSFAPNSPFWISNQGSGNSTLYDGAGIKQGLTVTIPAGTPPLTGPTGQVFNSTAFSSTPGFVLPDGKPAFFIFDSLNGTISGWNPGDSPFTAAVNTVSTPGAIYTGLALASVGSSNYLYAADSTGKIRVFDSNYKAVTLSGNFTDPKAVSGFVPFNIELIGSDLYVTYAKLSSMGTGLPGGYVDVFTTSGAFVKRLATGGPLYAPWGMALAPAGFGNFGNDLLIGNFGNGEINAYNPTTNAFVGTLDGGNGKPIVNDFLWSLDFRTGGTNADLNALYFTAGINGQMDGLFGKLDPAPEPVSFGLAAIGVLAIALFSIRRRILAK